MWKNIVLLILKKCLDYLYNFADKNQDGKLDKEEIESIVKLIRSYASKIKSKL